MYADEQCSPLRPVVFAELGTPQNRYVPFLSLTGRLPGHAVSYADMGLDKLRMRGILFKLFAQCCHENAQRGNVGRRSTAPDLLQDVIVREHLARVPRKQAQQLILYRREMYLLAGGAIRIKTVRLVFASARIYTAEISIHLHFLNDRAV